MDYIGLLKSEKGVLVMGYILGAWLKFKESHNIESAIYQDDPDTVDVFTALNAYEKLMKGE